MVRRCTYPSIHFFVSRSRSVVDCALCGVVWYAWCEGGVCTCMCMCMWCVLTWLCACDVCCGMYVVLWCCVFRWWCVAWCGGEAERANVRSVHSACRGTNMRHLLLDLVQSRRRRNWVVGFGPRCSTRLLSWSRGS